MIPANELRPTIAWVEYPTIFRRAEAEGWLSLLMAAMTTPCERNEARDLLDSIGLPADLKLDFKTSRSRARYSKRTRRYGISLQRNPGGDYRHLRVGLVIHEAAHVLDHMDQKKFSHGPTFCKVYRELLETTDWKEHVMPSGTMRDIYKRHPGRYSLLLTRAVVDKKNRPAQEGDRVAGPFSAEDAHEEARMLVSDPRENVVEVYVFSDTEGQFIGAFYKRGVTYAPWHEMGDDDGRVELPDQRTEAALLRGGSEPLQPVDAPVDTGLPAEPAPTARPVRNVPPKAPPQERAARVGPPRTVGRPLGLGRADGWPQSPAAQAVREFIDGKQATPGDIVGALGTRLNEMGVAHPASLVSRLKQAGFLKEVAA